MWARFVNAALGVWLMAAPAVLGYSGTAAATNDRIVGPVAASAAIIAMWEATRGLRRVNLLLGAWLIAAPWVLGHPDAAAWNSVLVGVATAAASLVRGRLTHRYAGGWAAVLGTGAIPPHDGDRPLGSPLPQR